MSEISAVVPLYNCERYIEECVRSLQRQTLSDIEIIVVDDGSRDRGFEICRALAEGDPRIRLVRQEHGGVSAARNNGILRASGECVAFLDSDDWVDPDLYEKLRRSLNETDADMALAGIVFEHPGASIRNPLPFEPCVWKRGEIESTCLPALLSGRTQEGRLTGCYMFGALYRRSRLLEQGILFRTELKRSEDPLFLLEAASGCGRIAVTGHCGYHYRKNPGSVTERHCPDVAEQWKLASPHFRRFAEIGDAARKAFYDRLFLSMSMEFKNYSLPGTPLSLPGQCAAIRRSLRGYWNRELIRKAEYHPTLAYQKLLRLLCRSGLCGSIALLYWMRTKIRREAVFR